MNLEEFLQPKKGAEAAEPQIEETTEETPVVEELDVQKAVVEELAADKAALDDEIGSLKEEIAKLKATLAEKEEEVKAAKESQAKAEEALKNNELVTENDKLKGQLAALQGQFEALKTALAVKTSELAAEKAREIDTQERNPNALALLDRAEELPDRFPGETRDHVIEVVKQARDEAEKEGRTRRAQLLEGVLVANEPNGKLAKKREEMAKLFEENGNLVTGPVIEKLVEWGISHKNGEEYLLPSEILKRNY